MKYDVTDMMPVRDQRRGWMYVFYPPKRSWFDKLLDWFHDRNGGSNEKKKATGAETPQQMSREG